eukprot:scaffold163253_cov31-Tisochrysis_lutea.AAC.6
MIASPSPPAQTVRHSHCATGRESSEASNDTSRAAIGRAKLRSGKVRRIRAAACGALVRAPASCRSSGRRSADTS